MKLSEANIEITRFKNTLSSISVIMPTWKHQEDEVLTVTIPLFGIKTFAKNMEDAEIAISEAIKCFCIASERFGKGVEKELEYIGWDFKAAIGANTSLLNYSIESTNVVLESIMETGDQFAENNLLIV